MWENRRRRVRLAVCASSLALLASACDAITPGPDGPEPEPAAEALATALAAGDLTGLPLSGATADEATTTYSAILEGMGEIQPAVTVAQVERLEGADPEPDTATATLTWTWPLGEGGVDGGATDGTTDGTTDRPTEWTYDVTADLSLEPGEGQEWQIAWDESLIEPSLAGSAVLEVNTFTGSRGDITGARGLAIVTNRPVVRVGIDRTLVGKGRAVRSASGLAQLVGVDATSYADRVEAAGDQAFVEAITFRADEIPPAVRDNYEKYKGARLIGTDQPLAPRRGFAAPILGSVGEVTAEMIEAEPDRFEVGDTAGLSGLQARYDEQLQGESGVAVTAVGSDGKEREVFRSEAVDGEPLVLTMDLDLQIEAELALADVGPASALVAIQPSTGNILAAANGPGTGGINLATFGQFAPGSTFKSVSALALLRSGLEPSSQVSCSPTITVDGKSFKNYSDYPSSGIGRIPLRTAVANSCNTAFIAERGRLKDGDLAAAAASLGLGVDHDLGFPAFFGSVEPATTQTGAAAALIGQGTVLASPMAMATVMASIQGGSLVVPRLIESVTSQPPSGVAPLKPAEAAQVKGLLRGVVTDGSGRGLADIPGPDIIAKTGTAEFADGNQIRTHAWMMAAQGDLAVAAFVRVGDSGSQTAGPILERFMRAAR
ncbi:penicillin-binding transpeptidase domain-containing protein [Nocardioides salsibiostraticola]